MFIAAVVVTYNRLNLLHVCLDAIAKQTIPLGKIYLVNNASTDGTDKWVKEFALEFYPNLKYIRLEENLGGAGGFAFGIKKAYEDGADYIWIMDDDVAPRADCLETLLDSCGDAGIIHPTRYDPDGQVIRWHQYYDPFTTIRTYTNIEEDDEEYLVATNVACFEGALIKRKVIDLVGVPPEKFFISHDDMIYGFLASRKFLILYTSKAKMDKLLPLNKKIPAWKIYYTIRNEIISQHIALKAAKCNQYIFFSKAMLSLNIVRVCFESVRSFQSAKNVLRGIVDGISMKNNYMGTSKNPSTPGL